jgi:hypothetical protein
MPDREGDPPSNAVRVLPDLVVAGAGPDLVEGLLAAEHAALSLRVGLAVGEHDLVRPGVGDGVDQGVVLRRLGRLEELDVVGDRLRVVAVDRVDHLGVERAWEGEPHRQLA